MANENDTNDKNREQSDDDVLKALNEFSESDDSEIEEAEEEEEATEEELNAKTAEAQDAEGTPSPAASGFVGMLAEQGKNAQLDASQTATSAANGGDAAADKIHIAKEIGTVPPPHAPAAGQAAGGGMGGGVRTVRKGRPAPGWYHAAVPVMYTLGALLILIGLWAVGALIFMAVKEPDEMRPVYWLLATDQNLEDGAFHYTKGSWMMAWTMLLCLPVSLVLGMMAGIMQRMIRSSSPGTEAKSK